jgi:pectinesterase
MPSPPRTKAALCSLLLLVQLAGTASGSRAAKSDDGGSAAAAVVRVGSSSAANASTVMAGLALVPNATARRWVVEIEPGVYRERVSTTGKGPVTLLGLGSAADVVVAFGCSNNNGTGQLGCMPCQADADFQMRATLTVGSVDFVGRNLTIANDACGYDASLAAQSEAVALAADRATFRHCRFLGGQDTVYTGAGPLRSYFADSFVNGSCDSIYGDSSSVFEQCTIHIVDHVTAHGGGSACTSVSNGGRQPDPSPECGADGHGEGSFYLIRNSSLLKPEPHEYAHRSSAASSNTELGRAWGDHAHVIYEDCFLDSHIAAHGWGCMGTAARCATCAGPPGSCEQTSKCYCQNMTLAESGSRGPGANPSKRVPWSQQLTKGAVAKSYSVEAALRGWQPPP